NDEVKTYSRAALKAFLETYPQIDAFGVSAGEHFGGLDPVDREAWMANTWGKAMNDYKKKNPESDFFFIHRYLMTGTDAIIKHFKDLPYHMDVSFKYVVGHMHGYVNPTLIYDVGVIDDIEKHNMKTWLNLRNDDMFYFRWNDPDYARQYIKNFPSKEKYIAGYYMGSDGYVFGKTFTFNNDFESLNNQMEFDKHWLSFKMWGMLGYNPNISNDYFVELISQKYPRLEAKGLFQVWQTASKIIPTVTSANWSRNDAQWYPEGCFYKKGYIDVEVFKNRSPQPGAPIYSIQEYKKVVLNKEAPSKTTPIEIAEELRTYSFKVLDEIKSYEMSDNLELQSLLLDMEGMAYLGLYYADKFEATVSYTLGDKEKALTHLDSSLKNWKLYAATLSKQYIPQNLARMNMSGKNKTRNDCMFDWNQITKAMEKEIEMVKGKND
ncbi:MAG: hypothetical protein MI922_10120, partial [Bacteroidales bacterium]|nr:hypothetical protein [Bacteroidales bacterium]